VPLIRIIAKDKALHKIVRSLLPDYAVSGEGHPDLLVTELSADRDCLGAEAIRQLRESNRKTPVVVISGGNSAAVTQQAVRLRVDDFFTLPAQAEAFKASVAALVAGKEAPTTTSAKQSGLIGNSFNMVALRKYVARVALTDSSVLILGETGTGKELVAELIHKSGARRDKPFIAMNAAAVPDSLFESELFGYEKGAFTGAYARSQGKLRQAHGGTIFFDEIGDIGSGAQAKLLRAIETREIHPLGACRGTSIDVRLIAATNRDIDELVRSQSFRQDLFYRLDVVRIEMPPLRSNREDIPQLLMHFVEVFNQRFRRKVKRFQSDAADLLAWYEWPGNIRQLRNVVEACFVNASSDQIEISDFPAHFRVELESKLNAGSRGGLIRALQASNWNISRAAWQLHCSRMTVYRKMARYRISRNEAGMAAYENSKHTRQ
jgi:DNA-binding NtrC family response regulator